MSFERTDAFFAGLCLGICIGALCGAALGVKSVRTEAVRMGHAVWQLDADGDTDFVWKPTIIEQTKDTP